MSDSTNDDTKRDDCLEEWRFLPSMKQTGTSMPSCTDTTSFTKSPCATPSVSSISQTETPGVAPSQAVPQEISTDVQKQTELLSELCSNLHHQLQRLCSISAAAEVDTVQEVHDIISEHLSQLRMPGVIITRLSEGVYRHEACRRAHSWRSILQLDVADLARHIDDLAVAPPREPPLIAARRVLRALYQELLDTTPATASVQSAFEQQFDELEQFIRLHQTGLDVDNVVVSHKACGVWHYGPPSFPVLHVVLDAMHIWKSIRKLAAMK